MTRIALITGEELLVNYSVAKVQEMTTNDYGQIYNDYVKVDDNTWIAAGKIVKLERIKETSDQDGVDSIVQY